MNKLINNNNKVDMSVKEKIIQLKNEQKMKEYEKINNLSTLTNLVIQPISIQKGQVDYAEKYQLKKNEYTNDALEYVWKSRTNVPYKNILKDLANQRTEIKSSDDLIVHRVSNNDKIGIKEKFDEIKKNIQIHNSELKETYSTTEELNHRKKFEYSHRYKYQKYNPSSFENLKKNTDTNPCEKPINKEMIIDSLIKDGIFNEDELKLFGLQ